MGTINNREALPQRRRGHREGNFLRLSGDADKQKGRWASSRQMMAEGLSLFWPMVVSPLAKKTKASVLSVPPWWVTVHV